jgi:hypothetical protein
VFVKTNQPAAFERVVDSIRGVLTQGFLLFEGDMLAMVNGPGLLCTEQKSKVSLGGIYKRTSCRGGASAKCENATLLNVKRRAD